MEKKRSSLMLINIHQGDEIDWIVDDQFKHAARLCLDWVPLVKLSFDHAGSQFEKFAFDR
jgi:hypothetical protein